MVDVYQIKSYQKPQEKGTGVMGFPPFFPGSFGLVFLYSGYNKKKTQCDRDEEVWIVSKIWCSSSKQLRAAGAGRDRSLFKVECGNLMFFWFMGREFKAVNAIIVY